MLEAGLAVLMAVLIVYCIKLNKRLTTLRNQNAEFATMMTGLNEASERAEQAIQLLKATGLSTEKSLRSAIEDASVVQVEVSRLVTSLSQATEQTMPRQPQPDVAPAGLSSPKADTPSESRRQKVQRDMLIGDPGSSLGQQKPAAPPPERPKTRKEAEETVLQAIRSARVGT
jgi:hypothetical protein